MRQGFLFDVSELLAGVKEFEHLKKKLENRRLDYDAKQNKLSKSKKEKPALEEEVRACQYKYEETYNDLIALMSRFGEREVLGLLIFPRSPLCRRHYCRHWWSLPRSRRSSLPKATR